VYATKARPVVIVQSLGTDSFDSVVFCPFTSFKNPEASTRVEVRPTADNGLLKSSFVMAEKVATVRKSDFGQKIGFLSDEQMHAVAAALARVLLISAADCPN
jgi:mRNA interferase MazF